MRKPNDAEIDARIELLLASQFRFYAWIEMVSVEHILAGGFAVARIAYPDARCDEQRPIRSL
ncbi:hypothetical protein D9M68_924930 [compost metagenome]